MDPTSSAAGQPATLTATLSGADLAAVDGESVEFIANGTGIGTGTLSSGIAILSVSTLPAGVDNLVALYVGDSSNYNARSNVVVEGVAKAGQAISGVTLTVTSSGSAVTSVPSGTEVTLAVSATASGSPVNPGTVTFCDVFAYGLSGQCGALGSAQLTSSGTASIIVRPGIGTHSLQAIFAGTQSDGAGASIPAPLTVTGKYPTSTGPFSQEILTDNSWRVSVNVLGTAPAQHFPSGTVQFLDQSNGNAVVATALLTPADAINHVFNTGAQAPATGTTPFSIATGDFNHDGFPDLAVANSGDNTVGIVLGKGDGTFQPQVSYAAGDGAYAIAAGDFNGDGYLDLAVTNFSVNTVSILLGNGDGTFQTQRTYATGGGPDAIAISDFDGDGNLDLAITNQTDATLSILLGKGDGTFQTQRAVAVGNGPDSVIVGDFNNDGNPDLVVANNTDNTVEILLGGGEGTFDAQATWDLNIFRPTSLAAADFNADGNLDLAVACANGGVTVLLGDGKGGWEPTTIAAGAGVSPEAVIAGNFSGQTSGLVDPDLAVVDAATNSVTVLANNGPGWFTGTGSKAFTAVGHYTTGGGPLALAEGDWNGDGLTDLAVLNDRDATVSVLLNGSGPWSYVPAFTLTLPGKHTLFVTYSGDSNYSESTSPAKTLSGALVATATILQSSLDPSNYGNPVTLTETLTPYMESDVSTDGDTVTFLHGTTVLGSGTLASGVATLTTSAIPVGADSLTASFPGDSNFSKSTSAAIAQTVRPATLTVTGPNVSRAFGAPNPSLSGTVSGAVNGDSFTVTGTTTATQTSSPGAYAIVPAASGTNLADYSLVTVNGTLTVTQATPAITVTSSESSAAVSAPVTFTATLTSSVGTPTGSVSFYDGTTLLGQGTLNAGVATYSTSALAAGTHTITAVYSGDANFVTLTSTALTESIQAFTLESANSSATVSAGGLVTIALTVTNDETGANANTSFACSGLPAEASCSFSPATVTGSGSTKLTIATTGTQALAVPADLQPWTAKGGAVLCACILVIIAPRRARRQLLFLLALAILPGLVLGCGGGGRISNGHGASGGDGGTGTPAGNYTVTVTATSGSGTSAVTQTTTITLTVQ